MPFVIDTFNEGGNIDLAIHTGELGATWTQHPDAAYTTPFAIDDTTRRIFSTSTAAYYASGVPAGADCYAQADFWHISTVSQNVAVCARMHETANTMYIGRLDSGTAWHIRSIVGGTQLTIGTSTNQLPTVGNFKTGKLVVEGDQISFYINGVLEIGPITNTAITAAGRVGVRNAGVASATTGMHLDNFEAGELTIAPALVFQTNQLRPAVFKPGLAR